MELRHAHESDLPRIVEIYNASIASRRSTADTEPVTVASRLEWFQAHRPARRPLLVHEEDNQIVGWISFEDFYGRPAYRHTAELSIYLAPESQGKQLGTKMVQAALALAPELGLSTLVGYVFSHNLPSLKLLLSCGFTEWGCLPDVAEMDDKEYSVSILGKRLHEGNPR
ncbi:MULTISPECIES: GNAT family N-acetyltransferase [Marinobacter]|uniref:N-acetyltransferase family protein n=1 Tax=Marinobacter xestospongiae TaxID=994319 RepID=A0ABU3VY08_9GAMM|nr:MULTISPECIES: GNAT family N-acetyltransferase [Marinobacter]MCG8518864.1 N-acetyltransferase family protein [Pseudomonadales bacterium]MCK7566031.1 GNAT family N-acetyltransferase [Marinobacter xestospongiae]MDV2079165.1 N-acetyltransferase family protein [Marinobacter xestospongiae]UDL06951.1 N-acetyltransferase [Marinobacter sp. CA1]